MTGRAGEEEERWGGHKGVIVVASFLEKNFFIGIKFVFARRIRNKKCIEKRVTSELKLAIQF